MGVNSLPKTVARQRCGCDLNSDPSAPESSTLTTRLPSHTNTVCTAIRAKKIRGRSIGYQLCLGVNVLILLLPGGRCTHMNSGSGVASCILL